MLLIDAGKVHGSLARAGKVRGQTPKVAKQDKKKKPRGRAHKRMQYNRRFVTAGTYKSFSSSLILEIIFFWFADFIILFCSSLKLYVFFYSVLVIHTVMVIRLL